MPRPDQYERTAKRIAGDCISEIDALVSIPAKQLPAVTRAIELYVSRAMLYASANTMNVCKRRAK